MTASDRIVHVYQDCDTEINQAELAVRICETLTGVTRWPGLAPEDMLGTLDADARGLALRIAAVAMQYFCEALTNAGAVEQRGALQ